MLNLNDGATQLSIHSNSLHVYPVLQLKYESLNSCLSWMPWFLLITLFNLRPTPKILKKWPLHVVMLVLVDLALSFIHLEFEQTPSGLLQSSHWAGLLFDLSATLAPLLILLASGFSGVMISNRWSIRSQDDFVPQTIQLVFLQVGVHVRLSRSSNDWLGSSSLSVMTLPVGINLIYSFYKHNYAFIFSQSLSSRAIVVLLTCVHKWPHTWCWYLFTYARIVIELIIERCCTYLTWVSGVG